MINKKTKTDYSKHDELCERCDRYDTYINGDYFQVYDNKKEKYIGKKYKYPSCADRFRETLIFI